MGEPEKWQRTTVGQLCDFSGGYGFRPSDWSSEGLPIIRIQNLNGSEQFNYFAGRVEADWLVHPGTILFAWAGTREVSFGPTIWNGPLGVLNQHIYRIHPKPGIDPYWLYSILQIVTTRIERKAHGFKTTLVHVHKSDITDQVVTLPPLPEQRKIAAILGAWDAASGRVAQLIAALQRRKQGLMQRLLTGAVRFPEFVGTEWSKEKAGNLFQPFSQRNNGDEELLSVTQEQGVVPRSMLDARVVMPAGSTEGYKLVEPGDFIISLRSFQGGIEYSQYRGLVSPAYTVLKPKIAIVDDFYKHLFKSREFIARLGVAIIGIRDGKQINYADFAALRLANPSLAEQQRIAEVLDTADREIALQQKRLAQLQAQKKGLMQRLLTGQVRVKVDSVTPAA